MAVLASVGVTASYSHRLQTTDVNPTVLSKNPVSLLGYAPAGAQEDPFKFRANAVSKVSANLEVVMREDFDKFTAGTETEFDSVDLTNTGTQMISDEYTQLPGWWGIGVYQAGGNCALAYPMRGGVLNTPTADLSGKLTIKLRAKAVHGQATMLINLLCGPKEGPQAVADMFQMTFDSENGWTEQVYEVENFYKGDDCFIQLNGMTYNMGIVIDYIEVSRDGAYIERPIETSAHSFAEDAFTAKWNKVEGAERYLVNLYEESLSGEPAIEIDEDFNGMDIADPQFPEGWDANFRESAVGEGGADNTTAVRFSDNDDYLVLPYNGGRLKELSFFVKPGADMDDYSYACIMVYGMVDGHEEWYPVGYLYAAQAGKDGAIMDMTDLVAGEYTAIKIACFYFDYDTDEVFIDNIHYVADEPVKRECVREDMEAKDNQLRIEGLDPELDYYFDVKAVKGEMVSESSPLQAAFGVATPVILDATDIDRRGAFTANWNAVPKATSYVVDLFNAATVDADEQKHVVLEEDFSKVESERTPDQPMLIGDIDYMELDAYTQTPGWLGSGVVVANGMLGVFGSGSYDLDLLTPYISLHNNNGDYAVEADVYAKAGETLVVQGFNGVASYKIEETGLQTIVFNLSEGVAKDRLMIYTLNHSTFLLDSFRVVQDLKEGDSVLAYVETAQVAAPETSVRFSGLDTKNGGRYAYTVNSLYQKYNASCFSDPSDAMLVDLTGSEVVSVPLDDAAVELALNGLELTVRTGSVGEISVYTLAGLSVGTGSALSELTVMLPEPGIYVVKVGDKAMKINVK